MMKTAVLIESEATTRDRIKQLMAKHIDITILALFSSCEEALPFIFKETPDIILLDIQMPDMSGLDFARLLAFLPNSPCIIFMTNSYEYALEAFDTPAVGYILKPIAEEKLANALKKARHLIVRKTARMKRPSKICILDQDKLIPIPKNEIICVFSKDRIIYIRTKNKEFISTLTMRELCLMLNETNFLCIHRKYIINLDEILEIIPWLHGAYQVRMNDVKKSEIPVSRNRTASFKTAVGLP